MTYTRKNQWDLFKILVHSELLQRYQGSILGFVWVFLKPLLLFLVLLFVFQIFAKSTEIINYPLYLLLGILTFNLFSEGTVFGMNALLNKGHIIKKVSFDRKLALLSGVAHAIINFFFSIMIFAVFSLYYGNTVSPGELLFYFYHVILLIVLIIGIVGFLSIITVWFRDISNIWEVVLLVLFYLTPVFYPLSIVPAQWQSIFFLNPLTLLMTNMRNIIINHDPVSILPTWPLVIFLFVFISCSYFFFRYYVKSIAEFI